MYNFFFVSIGTLIFQSGFSLFISLAADYGRAAGKSLTVKNRVSNNYNISSHPIALKLQHTEVIL